MTEEKDNAAERTLSVGMDMIYLISCALHGVVPAHDAITEMDLDAVHRMAAKHSLQVIVYDPIARYVEANGVDGLHADGELLARWKAEQAMYIRKTILFEMERERILSWFEEQKIWYAVLKGVIFQRYYPKVGMRQMCDNDILFDPAFRGAVRDRMVADGYAVRTYDSPYPDTYTKGQFSFEMHHALYTDSPEDRIFSDYYRNVKERLATVSEGSAAQDFSNEDFYIYCATHSYKHFSDAGNGVRALVDIYVYLRAEGEHLDHAYMKRELGALGIGDYDAMTRRLADKLFAPETLSDGVKASLSEEDEDMLLYFLDSGTYGSRVHAIKKRIGAIPGDRIVPTSKLRYFIRRIFPDMEYYRLHHPTVYRHKILIPFFWIYRFFRGIFGRTGKLFSELRTVFRSKS
ncbi:MAG: nucleotidyltransferase family protein [Clostridia bacterium]|nr:nucleotidyltransferase family protein [Clostridia bacterium]